MSERTQRTWSAAEKLRVIVEASRLSDEELRALLRREGIDAAQLLRWRADAEAALGASDEDAAQQKLRALFMQVPVAICTLEGPEHRFTLANHAYRTLVGDRELVGKPLLEALPELQGQGFEAQLDRVMASGLPQIGQEVPVRLNRAGTGQPEDAFFNFVFAPRRNATGEVDGIFVCAYEVTEQVRSREVAEAANAELEAILQSLPDALYVGNANGMTRANQAALDMLGYDNLAELNQNVATLAREIRTRRADTGAAIPGEDQAFTHALMGRADVQEVRVRHLKTGEDRVVRSSCAPIRVGSTVVGAVAINTDITEQKRAEETLRERANFEQQLIGIVSHDLRNPLNAIVLSAAALARRDDLDDRAAKSVLRIQSSAERAIHLVKDLLDFTQARIGGGIPIEPRHADVHDVVRGVLEEVEAAHPSRELRAQHEGDGRGEWDGGRLAQVVQNLVTNAVKYSPEGTPVEVTTRGRGRDVELTVHNVGTSIPPERLGHLFEPMERSAHTGAADRSVGLGLYIVEQIVAAHGGTIDVESTPAGGTTFTVRMPRFTWSPRSGPDDRDQGPHDAAPPARRPDGA